MCTTKKREVEFRVISRTRKLLGLGSSESCNSLKKCCLMLAAPAPEFPQLSASFIIKPDVARLMEIKEPAFSPSIAPFRLLRKL